MHSQSSTEHASTENSNLCARVKNAFRGQQYTDFSLDGSQYIPRGTVVQLYPNSPSGKKPSEFGRAICINNVKNYPIQYGFRFIPGPAFDPTVNIDSLEAKVQRRPNLTLTPPKRKDMPAQPPGTCLLKAGEDNGATLDQYRATTPWSSTDHPSPSEVGKRVAEKY